MKPLIALLLLSFLCTISNAQIISGKVINLKKQPISNVNVFISGSYDGASTDSMGTFHFKTETTGKQVLQFSSVGYGGKSIEIEVKDSLFLEVTLVAEDNQIEAVTVRAGQLSVGNQNGAVLTPLDIVTTAGSMGNIVAALGKLPGAQIAGENGRLMVRGGDPSESQTYINGILVGQPYTASANGVPVRGRFSPFLFKGTNFSTGGYGAEFGNALSGILNLTSSQAIEEPKTELSFSTVGLGLSNSQKWGNSSLSLNASYTNLKPYISLINQNITWHKPYEQASGEAIFRNKGKHHFFNLYASFAAEDFSFTDYSVQYSQDIKTAIKSNNYYLNSNLVYYLPSNWKLETGLGVSYLDRNLHYYEFRIPTKEIGSHAKALFKKNANRWNLMFGAEHFYNDVDEKFSQGSDNPFSYGFKRSMGAVSSEAQYKFLSTMSLDLGLRYMDNFKDQHTLEPRAALAYIPSKNHMVSFSYGKYHQDPNPDIFKFDSNLKWQSAEHYIFNYTFNQKGQMLRLEGFFKNYDKLITYNSYIPQYNSTFTNNGYGKVKGIDFFWKDSKTIPNLQYWISYSYTDSKKLERNYEYAVQPSYLAKHYFSIVGKYWIANWRSQLGLTNTYISGRPYNNPNLNGFMQSMTKAQNDLSFSWSFLLTQQKILFFSVTNILGNRPIYGYEYSTTRNTSGQFEGRAMIPTAKRFALLGFFWTISKNKKDNQLDQL